jgi:hypothetical protein
MNGLLVDDAFTGSGAFAELPIAEKVSDEGGEVVDESQDSRRV